MSRAFFCQGLAAASLLICAWSCSRAPGESLVWEDGAPLTLAGETRGARAIVSPHRLPQTAGRAYRLALANPGEAPMEVAVSDRGTPLRLPPQSWTQLSGRAGSEGLALSWSDGELLLSEVFLPPVKSDDRPNLLLISVDTLRADHFTAERMPAVHALFRERGVLFERVYSTAPWTLPAHVSLLAGQYPQRHGVRLPDQRMPAAAVSLAELLREAGYDTAAVVEGNYVSALFGLEQGFNRWLENPPLMMETDPRSVSKLPENLTTLQAEIDRLAGAPAFAFFHTYEVHCPYLPHGALRDEQGIGLTEWLLANDGQPLAAEDLDALRALYAGEARYADSLLAPLIEGLLDRGDWLVALTSDHGEEFGEHGGLLHADTLYEEAMRVPLALAGPGVEAGRAIAAAGSLVDVAPTLAALLAVAPPAEWQGVDLLNPNLAERPLFGESFFLGPHIPAEDPRLTAVWQGVEKLIQQRNFGEFSAELYDLAADPGERDNRQDRERARRDALFLLMETYLSGEGLRGEALGELTPEQLEVMKTLGYVQ